MDQEKKSPQFGNDTTDNILLLLKNRLLWKVLSVFLGLVFLRLGLNYYLQEKESKKPVVVKTLKPIIQNLDVSISLPGNVEAIEQASLYAHVSGYLKKLLADEGDKVKKNQILAEIDAPDIVDEYAKAKAEFDFKNVTRTRYQELLSEKVISQQEFDNINTSFDEAQAKFNMAATNMQYTRIRAPFDGSIARRYKYPGDLITSGAHGSDNPIFLVVNERKLRVSINVPQSDIQNVKIGHNVDIQVDSYPNETFSGTVSRMDAILDPSTKTQRVLIDLPNSSEKLHAGMFVSVVLHFDGKSGALTVPSSALSVEQSKSFLYVLADGKVKKVEVEIGVKSGEFVEIVHGLNENDTVIMKGITPLKEGMNVVVAMSSK